jgi:hypothetical protein
LGLASLLSASVSLKRLKLKAKPERDPLIKQHKEEVREFCFLYLFTMVDPKGLVLEIHLVVCRIISEGRGWMGGWVDGWMGGWYGSPARQQRLTHPLIYSSTRNPSIFN